MAIEERAGDSAGERTGERFVMRLGAPDRDDLVASHDALDPEASLVARTAAEADPAGRIAVLQGLFGHEGRLIGRIRGCVRPGGRRRSSTRSIRGRSRTRPATASAICLASSPASTI